MTVPSEINKSGPYHGNGVATVFAYGFKIVDAAHLRVVMTDPDGQSSNLVLNSDYTVTGIGNDSGGNVVKSTPLLAGYDLTIVRDVPFVQDTDLENQGAYYAETVEDALDLAAMRDQQLREAVDRAVKVPENLDAGDIDKLVEDITYLADVYIGAKPSDPTVRNDGSPLKAGDMYFNTTLKEMRLYDGGQWIGVTARSLGTYPKSFVGDGSETEFSLDLDPAIASNVFVWVGGVRQVPDVDYTVSGSTVTLTTAPGSGVAVDTLVLFQVGRLPKTMDGIFDSRADVEITVIDGAINTILTGGYHSGGDGLGGLYIDTDNGSTDTVQSADGRTWYRARDVGEERLTDTLVKFIQGRPTARVEAKITSTGKRYDIIEIKGGNASDYIRQVINPDQGDPTVQRRIPVRDFANKYNVPIAVNSQAFRNADGSSGWDQELLIPNGLLISDNTVITDWDSGTNAARNQGVAMQKNGKLVPIYRDGKNAQQLVDEGVRWAVSWGALCVLNGAIIPNINSGFMGSSISARTVYGQRSNGDFIILLFEGVSGSSGVSCDEVSPVALEHGCEIAFIVEGGGSTQAWWNSYYAHGSSDRDSFRTMPSCLIVDAITENEYDSGWIEIVPSWDVTPALGGAYPISIRQFGANINLYQNATPYLNLGTFKVPHPRFYPDAATAARVLMIGGGGYMYNATMGGGTNIGWITVNTQPLNTGPQPTSLAGMMSWLQRSY